MRIRSLMEVPRLRLSRCRRTVVSLRGGALTWPRRVFMSRMFGAVRHITPALIKNGPDSARIFSTPTVEERPMWLMRTAFKICFPHNGLKVVARDIVRTIDNAMASGLTSERVSAPVAAPVYVECRVQHTTEANVDACSFHSRSENTPHWLRVERFAKTWNRSAEPAKE